MKNFIKLVNFELKRFFPIYAALGILTAVIQLIGVFISSNNYHQSIENLIQNGVVSESNIIQQIGLMGMSRFTETLWFWIPIGFCIAALLIYALFIWYRDWLGKNTFIYRLLMLPTERLNIYFSKAVTIFLMVLGLIALQLVLLFAESLLFSLLIPGVYLNEETISQVIQKSVYLQIFYPSSFIAFIAYYSMGFIELLVLFTLILLERSFKIKGILLAGIYRIATLILLFSPYWLQATLNQQLLFNSELVWILQALAVGIGIISIWISHRLLNKRITV